MEIDVIVAKRAVHLISPQVRLTDWCVAAISWNDDSTAVSIEIRLDLHNKRRWQ
jgi:hypothetical protein